MRGNEEGCAVLIAARKDNTSALTLLDYYRGDDHEYPDRKKESKWQEVAYLLAKSRSSRTWVTLAQRSWSAECMRTA